MHVYAPQFRLLVFHFLNWSVDKVQSDFERYVTMVVTIFRLGSHIPSLRY